MRSGARDTTTGRKDKRTYKRRQAALGPWCSACRNTGTQTFWLRGMAQTRVCPRPNCPARRGAVKP